ncbi:helix-turn-helix domain-containing protein [Rhizobium sp. BR 362]|uniref:helix-turn-helix domain-containing protein n=1 Tax=Rhizobium sp. BR 362 TaxID=3040670 RepID=UPI002F426B4B
MGTESRQQKNSTSDSEIHPVDLHVGQQIRILRIQSNLSLSELAKDMSVSLQQLQKYETGRNRVSASRLYEMAACLQVPVDRFFQGLPAPGADGLDSMASEVDERIAYISTTEGRRLIEEILRLSPKVKRRILSIVSVLAQEKQAESSVVRLGAPTQARSNP